MTPLRVPPSPTSGQGVLRALAVIGFVSTLQQSSRRPSRASCHLCSVPRRAPPPKLIRCSSTPPASPHMTPQPVHVPRLQNNVNVPPPLLPPPQNVVPHVECATTCTCPKALLLIIPHHPASPNMTPHLKTHMLNMCLPPPSHLAPPPAPVPHCLLPHAVCHNVHLPRDSDVIFVEYACRCGWAVISRGFCKSCNRAWCCKSCNRAWFCTCCSRGTRQNGQRSRGVTSAG